MTTAHSHFLHSLWSALEGDASALQRVHFHGAGELPSVFETTALAAASMGAAGLALSSLCQALGLPAATAAEVQVDSRLASFWFSSALRPQGWSVPPPWDAVAGDYRTADGWIRLHTNASHHRAAALAVLQVPADRAGVAGAVASWEGDALEAAVVAQGGCAGRMRSASAWLQHPQGQAVQAEPLLHRQVGDHAALPAPSRWQPSAQRPLRGLRVLDMTRVLAGPVATRMLAGLGAEVLRIDPPWWDEPAVVPEMTWGKYCARLDLQQPADRARWETLLASADVLVHGYRSDALERMGLGAAQRQQLCPGLVDVSLNAYGFSGPWAQRRSFDSIVQMSSGIAEAGQRAAQADKPIPLPVQALDHATGYLLAAAVLRGLEQRVREGRGSIARASLARTAALLMSLPRGAASAPQPPLAPESPHDLQPGSSPSFWGPTQRLRWPLALPGIDFAWERPAGPLGSAPARWQAAAKPA